METFKIPSHFLHGDGTTGPALQKKTYVQSLITERSAECCCLCNFSWNQTDRFGWVGGGDSGTGAVKATYQQRCAFLVLKEASEGNTQAIFTPQRLRFQQVGYYSASETSVPSLGLKTRSIVSPACCFFVIQATGIGRACLGRFPSQLKGSQMWHLANNAQTLTGCEKNNNKTIFAVQTQ